MTKPPTGHTGRMDDCSTPRPIVLLVTGLLIVGCTGILPARASSGQPPRIVTSVAEIRPAAVVPAVDVTLAAGKLEHHGFSNELFHIHDLWIRVAEKTEFHRWLSEGIGHDAEIVLVANAAKIADDKGARLLIGKLIHETAPNPTPNTVNVVGDLPAGDLPMVHVMFLKDEQTGTIGAATLETTDGATALKFQDLDGKDVVFAVRIK